jgi:hypothetical protein
MTTNQQWVTTTTTGRVVFHLRARAAFFNTITFKIGMATARRRDLSIHYSIWTPSFFNPTKKNVCSTAAACRLWRLYGCHTSIPYLNVGVGTWKTLQLFVVYLCRGDPTSRRRQQQKNSFTFAAVATLVIIIIFMIDIESCHCCCWSCAFSPAFFF